MKSNRNGLAVICAALLYTAAAASAETSDSPALANEVERYLAAAEQEAAEPDTLRVYFANGIKLESADGAFKVALRGRLHWDNDWRRSSDFGPAVTADGTYFRRVRLGISGSIHRATIFKIEVDFAGQSSFVNTVASADGDGDGEIDSVTTGAATTGSVVLKDVYVGLRKIPILGTLKAGHFHEPIGLEELSSANYLTFLERSAPSNAFTPRCNGGIGVANSHLDRRLFWEFGIFRTTDDQARATGDGGYNVALRVTGFAVQHDDVVVHVGIALNRSDPASGTRRFRARPGTGRGPSLVDTGSFAVRHTDLGGLEFAVIWRSLHLQAEYFVADNHRPGAPNATFSGYYVEAAVWITGERTRFKGNVRARPKPRRGFLNGTGGPGAWQVAARFASLDLNAASIAGGDQQTVTIGLNWHWNPNARLMLNYILADLTNLPATGELHTLSLRLQLDF